MSHADPIEGPEEAFAFSSSAACLASDLSTSAAAVSDSLLEGSLAVVSFVLSLFSRSIKLFAKGVLRLEASAKIKLTAGSLASFFLVGEESAASMAEEKRSADTALSMS